MSKKISTGNKLGLIVMLLILFAGIFFNRYIPVKIFNESSKLTNTTVTYSLSMNSFLFDLLCIVLVVLFAIALLVSIFKKSGLMIIGIHILTIFVISLVAVYFPETPKPWYRYQFEGFVYGVKKNINYNEFYQWVNDTVINMEAGEKKMLDRNSLAFLSKNKKLECETYIDKYKNGIYEIKMHWGGPMGHYGLFICNDQEKIKNMQNDYDMTEIYADIWGWTENK
jgi:hypothetical protein